MNTTSENKRKGFIQEFCKQNQLYLLAFAIPFFIMLLMFIINFIYPFGDQSFLNTDLSHQYLPFLKEFSRKLKEGESLVFSWNTGLGSNFLALYAYYLATPFYWLSVFVPETYLIEFISYLVVLKIGLCGFTSCFYFSRHFNTKRRVLILFSLFYALSGYMAAYNWNVMWLDCLVLAPLIILGLEELVNKGKYKLYCISLGMAILSNYYLSIIICIYLVLYFFIVLLPLAKKKITAFSRFTLFSLLAGGLGATLLFPTASALTFSSRTSDSFPAILEAYSSLFDVLARHFMNVTVETVPCKPYYWPNIYCSVGIFILFPLYLLNKKITSREKIGKIVLLLIMLLSFSYNITSYIWHGFTYPNALPARQSFLYILLMLTVCLEAFMNIHTITGKELTITFSGVFLYVFLAQKLVTNDSFTAESVLSTAGFLIIYAVFLYLYLNKKISLRYASILLAVIVIAEAMGNTMATSIFTISRTQYLQNHDTYRQLSAEQTQQDNGKYYRYDKSLRSTNNDSLLDNYPSLSMFSSTGNVLVNHFYNKYGMEGSNVNTTADGTTPFLYAMLSGGYTFSNTTITDETFYELVKIEDYVALYRNKYSVPLGFCIAPNQMQEQALISDIDTTLSIIRHEDEDLLPLDRQNVLASNLGASEYLFNKFICTNTDEYSTIEVLTDSYVYVYFDSAEFQEVSVYIDEEKINTLVNTHNRVIMSLGYYAAGTTLTLYGEKTTDSENYPEENFDGQLHVSAYGINTECFADLIQKLNANTLTIEAITSNYLSGTITSEKDGYLILSIPYDPGFTVLVDDVETTPLVFDDMMMAIPLTAGDHTVFLTYWPLGLNAGIFVSLLSISVLILIGIIKKKKTRAS